MLTTSDTLTDHAQDLILQLTSPTSRIVQVGPHILFIDSASGQALDLRRPKALNKLLRDRGLMKSDQQVTEALHYAILQIIEGDGEYLELNLQARGMLDDYRKLLAVMRSKRNTGQLILQLVAQYGFSGLAPQGEPMVELKDWMIELPIDLASQWSSFEPFEPRVN